MKGFDKLLRLPFAIALFVPTAQAGDVCMPVNPATLVIAEDTRLTCDMTCTTTSDACIRFGAPGIKLDLNGHKVSGPAVPSVIPFPPPLPLPPPPPPRCPHPLFGIPPGDGIASAGFSDVVIQGPGLVERFRRHGIFLTNLQKAEVKKVTIHHNCSNAISLENVELSLVEEVVAVRNGGDCGSLSCGGAALTSSRNNKVRRSEFDGNGANIAGENDFGVGLLDNSTGNLVEENGIGGNTNGIWISISAAGNTIIKNVIAGNPQVQPVFEPTPNFDIRDFSPPASNVFLENLCIAYGGASIPPPCPNFPQFSGHQNN